MEYKLTIALITMNRADQLKLAIESCAAAILPESTQFVIVDNGSVDNTEAVVNSLKQSIGYDLVYHKEPINLGAGLGRNVCFELSKGEYIFFLDDDAEIPKICRETFFAKSVAYLDRNPNVASLTTEIEDNVFGQRPVVVAKTTEIESLKSAYTFHEGSVFFRKKAYSSPLYMDIMYGGENLSVSIGARDRGFYNVFDPEIYIEHHPQVNKWKGSDSERLTAQAISNAYAIKKMCYPIVFTPIVYLAFKKRLKKHHVSNKIVLKEMSEERKKIYKTNKVKKSKIGTVLKSYKEFGLTVF